jgi:hypothetical protein
MTEFEKDFELWWESCCKINSELRDDCMLQVFVKSIAHEAWKTAKGELETPKPKERKWCMELLYKTNYQYISKILHLGDHVCIDKKEAEELAKQKAITWMEDVFKKNEIEKWEVRARPARF